MAFITEPQSVLQKPAYSRRGTDESVIDDGMKGKLRRDTVSGKLKFWSGSGKKMDDWALKTDVEYEKDVDSTKDMEEWEDLKLSHDSSADPLNWSPQRKTLSFFTLCLAFSIVGMQRLMFASVNAGITAQFSISSTQTAALTGIAFILSATSSPCWEMLSMKLGKRLIFIFAAALMLVGSLWNMYVMSYGQLLVGRMMQGVGWGAFEGLIGGAVGEMYFESQLPIRLTILSTIDVFFTWGTPIIGGYLSQTIYGYGNQIMIMTIIQTISVLLFILAFPETSFNRTSHPTPPLSPPTRTLKTWLKTLHPIPYHGNPSKEELSRPIKGLISPITLLTFILSSLPIASSYAFSLNLSSFLSGSPLFIFPSQIGYIFIGPFLLSTFSYSILSIISPNKPNIIPSPENPKTLQGKGKGKGSPTNALRIAIPGLILFVTGIIAFTQYVSTTLIPKAMELSPTVFVTSNSDTNVSLRVISLVFGILVSGATILRFAIERYLSLSSSSSSSSLTSSSAFASTNLHKPTKIERKPLGEHTAYNTLQNFLTGLLIIAIPKCVEGGMGNDMGGVMGLKDTGLGVGVFGFVGGVGVVAGLWIIGGRGRRIGGEMMGRRTGGDEWMGYGYRGGNGNTGRGLEV
ncbi:0f35bedd-e1ca-4f0e-a45b-5ce0aec2143c [Sclerotinia trifoliorum]|uniref:0f35bedd-e1ca-4f0e-a45b-5ce0aec2143c n=1 Tax=Sclerotinia trifoliorum TaxID=28548 RepID=A0A8H2ZV11_9HELO|nr:0f35bedd-e1ca-4f0e-a45b-5ce0aec2143c [Sclerotinia trifoliorum]